MGYALDNIRVLVVDQNVHFRQLLRTILQSVGARTIDLSGCPLAGFETYCRHEYDMVFADFDMDPLSGYDFVDLIRTSRQSPNPYVSIIMLSAASNKERIQLARDHGVSEFVAKPFSVDSVIKHLEVAIECQRSFVRTGTFFGPDRRRKSSLDYAGPERRQLELEEVTLSRQDLAMQRRLALQQQKRANDDPARSETNVHWIPNYAVAS